MPKLTELKQLIPSADSIAGRVICLHNGTHYDLGQYVGDDTVVLSTVGQALVDSLTAPAAEEKAREVSAVAKAAKKRDLSEERL